MVLDNSQCMILQGKVMHHRHIPQPNKFLYSVFYIHMAKDLLEKISGNFLLGINRPAAFSMYSSDHGDKKLSLNEWIESMLSDEKLDMVDRNNISLIALPRVLGFVFNPVSFWLCKDKENNLRAVICEVNNTFGEKHTYVCYKEDKSIITGDEDIIAQKIFHVSPFLEREGFYKLRFTANAEKFMSTINYYNDSQDKILSTSIVGKMATITNWNLIKIFLLYPFMTFRVVFLIHWQALKIWLKGISYVPKPKQKDILISHSVPPTYFSIQDKE